MLGRGKIHFTSYEAIQAGYLLAKLYSEGIGVEKSSEKAQAVLAKIFSPKDSPDNYDEADHRAGLYPSMKALLDPWMETQNWKKRD